MSWTLSVEIDEQAEQHVVIEQALGGYVQPRANDAEAWPLGLAILILVWAAYDRLRGRRK